MPSVRALRAGSRRNKYGNKKVEMDGHTFDSKKEAGRYYELKLLARAGQIKQLSLQPAFTLLDSFVDIFGETHRTIKYIADFSYIDAEGRMVVEDVKSEATRKDKVYVIKKKLFLKRYQEYIFKEI